MRINRQKTWGMDQFWGYRTKEQTGTGKAEHEAPSCLHKPHRAGPAFATVDLPLGFPRSLAGREGQGKEPASPLMSGKGTAGSDEGRTPPVQCCESRQWIAALPQGVLEQLTMVMAGSGLEASPSPQSPRAGSSPARATSRSAAALAAVWTHQCPSDSDNPPVPEGCWAGAVELAPTPWILSHSVEERLTWGFQLHSYSCSQTFLFLLQQEKHHRGRWLL